tara:strand:+ start:3887 stop:4252 length:366 start_codon:yes stop_codon:yes gene_type:complete
MNNIIKLSLIFIFIDFIWIFNNINTYNNLALLIQGENVLINCKKIISGLLIYFFLILGMYKFVINDKNDNSNSIIYGAVVYGVYSFTNYLLFKKYPLKLAIIDTLWGCVLCYLTKYFYFKY